MPNVSTGGGDPAQPPERGDGRLLARRYRLLTVVGHGGMGTVWHAHDEVLGRDVAVKEVILPHGMSQDEREVHHKRTFREARTAARLAHPSVVTVFDVVEEGGRPWIIMELIKAPSLDQVIKDKGRLPPRRAAQIARQMLGALHTAHEAGVLHRDVKPSNVLVAPGDRVVLTDFGIATAAGDVTLTQTGLVMGSPAYIAPERARGRTAGPASDLWALGITLYAMVEGGASPYERSEPMAALIAVISEDPEPPVHAGPLRPIIDGLLRKDPEARLSALEAGAMLDQVVRGLATTRRNTLPLTQVSDDAAPTSLLSTAGGDRPGSAAEPPARTRSEAGTETGTGDDGEDAGGAA
ncbi:MAG TPA: serine/threonine-protein kinase, partial [Streptosporangiaceae bacterium]|nr:serine/threonine-protein kinase [Streptosporangiaceae bacterium]